MTRRTRTSLIVLLIFAATAAALAAMGRPPICTCGEVALWGPVGPTQSQMLADWYSPSHIIHGFLFYALLWLIVPKWTVGNRLVVATLVEVAWELVENTPMAIDRYRNATISLGYTGDTIINSLSDIAMMVIGFALARKLPVWLSILLVLVLELVPLLVVRDNLTLNVIMFLAPNETILEWQARG